MLPRPSEIYTLRLDFLEQQIRGMLIKGKGTYTFPLWTDLQMIKTLCDMLKEADQTGFKWYCRHHLIGVERNDGDITTLKGELHTGPTQYHCGLNGKVQNWDMVNPWVEFNPAEVSG